MHYVGSFWGYLSLFGDKMLMFDAGTYVFPANARLAVKRPTLHVNRIKTHRTNKDTLPDKLYTYDDRQGGISIKKPQKSLIFQHYKNAEKESTSDAE